MGEEGVSVDGEGEDGMYCESEKKKGSGNRMRMDVSSECRGNGSGEIVGWMRVMFRKF